MQKQNWISQIKNTELDFENLIFFYVKKEKNFVNTFVHIILTSISSILRLLQLCAATRFFPRLLILKILFKKN